MNESDIFTVLPFFTLVLFAICCMIVSFRRTDILFVTDCYAFRYYISTILNKKVIVGKNADEIRDTKYKILNYGNMRIKDILGTVKKVNPRKIIFVFDEVKSESVEEYTAVVVEKALNIGWEFEFSRDFSAYVAIKLKADIQKYIYIDSRQYALMWLLGTKVPINACIIIK